jgi:cell division protein FtsL
MRMILRVMCAMATRYRRVVTTSGGTVKQRLVANKHSTVVSVVVLVVVLVLVVYLLSSIMSKLTTTGECSYSSNQIQQSSFVNHS